MTIDWASRLITACTVTVLGQDGHPSEITVSPRVRDRVRDGQRRVTVYVLPFLLDEVAAVHPRYRAFAADMLRAATVELRADGDADYAQGAMRHVASHRRDGRVRTSYNGEGIVPVSAVLDLGEQLWDHFFARAATGATASLNVEPRELVHGNGYEVCVLDDGTTLLAPFCLGLAAGTDHDAAQQDAARALSAHGWTVTGEWEQHSSCYTVAVQRA